MGKSVIAGVLAAIVFLCLNSVFSGMWLPLFGGDPFTITYHDFTYMGIVFLFGLIVFCTLEIIRKINELMTEMKNAKK